MHRLLRHDGVSFVSGTELIHLWCSGIAIADLRSRWSDALVERRLAEPLIVERLPDGRLHAFARAYVFLPLNLVAAIVEASAPPAEAIAEQLDIHAADHWAYSQTYALYAAIAHFRGWVAQPLQLGTMPAVFFGIGRHSHLRVMNVGEDVTAPIVWAGLDKAVGRDLLRAHGFPVAPSALAHTAALAVARAEELGYPVVLKKLTAGNSDGVILGISEGGMCRSAAERLLRDGNQILIEKMIEGIELRLHFSDGKLIRIWQCEPRTICGDGVRSFGELIAESLPEYWATVSTISQHGDRLLLSLWSHGVREWPDLQRVVPPAGKVVRVSAATGATMTACENGSLHVDDVARFEQFFERYGAPSAGVDLILPSPGARLSTGTVIEINAPCGMNYLGSDVRRVADRELLTFARSHPDFTESGGRVPVWLIHSDDFPSESKEFTQVVSAFKSRWPGGRVAELDPASKWLPILTDKAADAFLIYTNETVIETLGMPVNLRPQAVIPLTADVWSMRYPQFAATVNHAGGHIVHFGGEAVSDFQNSG